VARGTLLRVTQASASAADRLVFRQHRKGRKRSRLTGGKWNAGRAGKRCCCRPTGPTYLCLRAERRPADALLAEQLQDAEQNYPAPWIEDASRSAELNKRSWRYVQASGAVGTEQRG